MKKLTVITLVVVLMFGASSFAIDAAGSGFGNLMTAKAQGQGKGNFGGGVGIADATSFFGSFTYGLSRYMDGRLHMGMSDPGDNADAELIFGADIKWQMWGVEDSTSNRPFDFAIGGLFEYVSTDFISVLQLGGFALGSYPFVLSNGSTLSPYGRLNLRLENLSYDWPAGFPPDLDDSESNLEFGLHAGVAWKFGSTTTAYAEFQLDGNDGLFLGIDFNVM